MKFYGKTFVNSEIQITLTASAYASSPLTDVKHLPPDFLIFWVIFQFYLFSLDFYNVCVIM